MGIISDSYFYLPKFVESVFSKEKYNQILVATFAFLFIALVILYHKQTTRTNEIKSGEERGSGSGSLGR